MTDEQWLACNDIREMIAFVDRVCCRIQPPTVTRPDLDRPLRLFAVGGCRTHWELFLDPDARAAVETAEQFADGLVTRDALRQAASRANNLGHRIFKDRIRDGRFTPAPDQIIRSASLFAAAGACDDPVDRTEEWERLRALGGPARRSPPWWFYSVNGTYRIIEETAEAPVDLHHAPEQANLLRDVFGNPFRPVTFSPAWRTSTAVALAGQMYESRDFGAMPILADALQDAGCDSAEVLAHCRGPGPHVRGCWVADLVLGEQ